MKSKYKKVAFLLVLGHCMLSCKKIEIPPPVGTITTTQVFSTDAQAISATSGMYSGMTGGYPTLASGGMTVLAGVSADELIFFNQTFADYANFQQNALLPTNTYVNLSFWTSTYTTIYSANAIIEGLENYKGVNDSLKNELTGEAEFTRAFCNFYLTNLFGDIPLVTTINWHKTNLLVRTPQSQVYQAIIADLKDAQNRLSGDYSAGKGQRIIPNKWAATALLARVYLYLGEWQNARDQSNAVISSSNLYSLTADLNNVFLINSTEAIWQLQQSNSQGPFYNATPEGQFIVPETLNTDTQPTVYLTNQLLNAFEPHDQRRTAWIDSTLYTPNGLTYYFPYKYKMGSGQATPDGQYSEYYMVLRLAEQYLIRAEAQANGAGNGVAGAISDLNIIRHRAGLPDYAGTMGTAAVLSAIAHERQVELFAEWGHRWLDLKRTKTATTVLSANKGFVVTSDALLFPIPQGELTTDPNLTQNPGY